MLTRTRIRSALIVVALLLLLYTSTGCCCFCSQAGRFRRPFPWPRFRLGPVLPGRIYLPGITVGR